MKINVFLPCRKGSQRVPRKNIKPFGNYKNGLLENKLNQLLDVKEISKIFLSSDDNEVLDYATSLQNDRIILHKRNSYLSSSTTQTDELVKHAYELIKDGEILWTHVTSPFFTSENYSDFIQNYKLSLQKGYDSAMSATKFYGFLWDNKTSFNYDRKIIKWPQTQNIQSLFEINSAAFIANSQIYKTQQDRIGKNPYFYITDKISGFDIDWEDDFKIAEAILKTKFSKRGGRQQIISYIMPLLVA